MAKIEEILLLKENAGVSNRFCNEYVSVAFAPDNMLDIEFFSKSEHTVKICIKNQQDETVYELEIFTAPTLHILVDTKHWDKGLYSIRLTSENSSVFYAVIY